MKTIQSTLLSLSLLVSILFVIFCTENPVDKDDVDLGKSENGYFFISTPSNLTEIKMDSVLLILWNSSNDVPPSTDIRITLFKDTTPVTVIAPSIKNSGTYSWAVENFGTSDKYRIKITVLTDTSAYDYSGYFRIFSGLNGSIEVTSPVENTEIILDSTFLINWITTGNIGTRLNLNLYRNDEFIAQIAKDVNVTSGFYSWNPVTSPQGSGTGYQIEAISSSDASIKSMSNSFSIKSFFTGSYSISSPVDSSVFTSGQVVSLKWTSTGTPGPFVKIDLYEDTTNIYTIDSMLTDTGAYYWYIPKSITSSSNYKLKLTSVGDPAIFAFTNKIFINGIDPDIYEPDNSRDSASQFNTGITQEHTITVNDTDWIAFSADSGQVYLLKDSAVGFLDNVITLFLGDNDSYIYKDSTVNYNGLLYKVWTPTATGKYYARIVGMSDSSAGTYFFSCSKFDPLKTLNFISPTINTKVSTSTEYDIQWTADTSIVGNSLEISLYKGGLFAQSLSSTNIINNGLFHWVIGDGIASGSDYQIKLSNTKNETLYALSPYFTINGIVTDTFEYDNIIDSASTINLGTFQNHSITLGDIDWVEFDCDSFSFYAIYLYGVNGFNTSIKVLDPNDSLVFDEVSDSLGIIKRILPAELMGKYKISVSATNVLEYGSYSVGVTNYNPDSAITFLSPIVSTVWKQGDIDTIKWIPDTMVLGDTATLAYFRSTGSINIIDEKVSVNSGSYNWTIPSTIADGEDYRIALINNRYSDFFGISDSFTLSKYPKDIYEDDNNYSTASAIEPLQSQQRTITLNDTDWISFSGKAGSEYLIRSSSYQLLTSGKSSLRLYYSLYSNPDSLAIDSYTTSSSNADAISKWIISTPVDGTYYLKCTASSSLIGGYYSLSFDDFDSSSAAGFSFPQNGSVLMTDSTYNIVWTADTSVFGNSINLYLMRNGVKVENLISSGVNSGAYSFTVAKKYISDNSYSLILANSSFTEVSGKSAVFTIQGPNGDDYELDNKRADATPLVFGVAQEHNLTYNDTDWVKFDVVESQLYIFSPLNNSTCRMYMDNETSSSGSGNTKGQIFTWKAPKSGTCYTSVFCLSSYKDSLVNYSINVSPFDSLKTVNVLLPDSNTNLNAGETIIVQWDKDSLLLGSRVRLYLYQGDELVESEYTNNTGTYNFSNLSERMKTSNDYRVKVANYNDEDIYGVSQNFTVTGITIEDDIYEEDDTRETAKEIGFMQTQDRTLIYSNQDWVKFSGTSGKTYFFVIVPDSGHATYTNLYFENGTQSLYSQSNSYFGTKTKHFKCTASGTYYLCIKSTKSETVNKYKMFISSFDSTPEIEITQPTASTVLNCTDSGSSAMLDIAWNNDTSFIRSYVSAYLLKDGRIIKTKSSSSAVTMSGGVGQYPVPYGIASGDDYSIRLVSSSDTSISGTSNLFTITGVDDDIYEFDNTMDSAKVLPIGTTQTRFNAFSDTDMVAIDVDSGVVYTLTATTVDRGLAGAVRTSSGTFVDYFKPQNAPLADNTTTEVDWQFPQSGRYYIWFYDFWSGSSSYIGSYTVGIKVK